MNETAGNFQQKRIVNTVTKINTVPLTLDPNGAFQIQTECHAFGFTYSATVDAIFAVLKTGEEVLLVQGASWDQEDWIRVKKVVSLNGAADSGAVVYVTYGDAIITGIPLQSALTIPAVLEVIDDRTGLPTKVNGNNAMLGIEGTAVEAGYTGSLTLGDNADSGTASAVQVGAFNTSFGSSSAAASLYVTAQNMSSPVNTGGYIVSNVIATKFYQGCKITLKATDTGSVSFVDSLTGDILEFYPPDGSQPVTAVTSSFPFTYGYVNCQGVLNIEIQGASAGPAWKFTAIGSPAFVQPEKAWLNPTPTSPATEGIFNGQTLQQVCVAYTGSTFTPIAAVAGKQVFIQSYTLNTGSGAEEVEFVSSVTSTAYRYLVISTGVVNEQGSDQNSFVLSTPSGEGLKINLLGGGVQVAFSANYYQF